MLPIQVGELDAFEAFSIDVAPEADTGRARVGEGEIHPAVFVEIKSYDADGGREIFFLEVDGAGERSEFAFARIQQDGCAVSTARDYEVDCAIVIEVGGDDS